MQAGAAAFLFASEFKEENEHEIAQLDSYAGGNVGPSR